MSEALFRSALAERSDARDAQGLSIAVREITERGMIDVRGEAHDDRFTGVMNEVLGFLLPLVPRTSIESGTSAALWLSVDQWLITLPRAEAAAMHGKLGQALRGVRSLIVDMSDARTILRLQGEGVREVLNKGTSVDFTGPDMVKGAVRRLRYAEVAAMVHVISTDPDIVDLYVFRSYADHAWTYLVTTARQAARIKLFGRQEV